MAKKKADVRNQITDSKLALKKVMTANLSKIAESMIAQIMKNLKNLSEANRLNAIKGVNPSGVSDYASALRSAMAVVAANSLKNVRKEIPKAKNVKLSEIEDTLFLGEFDDLPPDVRRKVQSQQQLLLDTQMADLQKAVNYQFNHSVDSTDSMDTIQNDLESSAEDYISGAGIEAGAATVAAQVINETRNAFFDDPDVQEQIEAFEFVNGDPVSQICQDLAGTVFAVDDPNRFRYTPPLHFNCKSYIAPILSGNLDGRQITDLKPSTKEIEDTIQFAETVCGCGQFHVG